MHKSFLPLLTATSLLFAPVMLTSSALAQRVVDVNPGVNSQNVPPDTSVYGQFDAGTGPAVDINSVRVLVNGRDVTTRSTITRNFFSYRPDQPFAPGPVQVQVNYRNVNGAQLSSAWTFNVQQPQAAIQINSVTHNAVSNPINAGSNFLATINGTSGLQGSVLLIQDGRTVRELPAQEVSPGIYVATLGVQSGDRLTEGIVVGRLRRQNQVVYGAAAQPVAFNVAGTVVTQPPSTGTTPGTTTPGTTTPGTTTPGTATPGTAEELRPRFTSHRSNDRVNRGFTVVGQTQPNATVQVNVTSGLAVLGINVAQETLVNNRQVTADRNGRFEVVVPAPRIPVSGTRYTVRATARSGNVTSPTTEITLVQE